MQSLSTPKVSIVLLWLPNYNFHFQIFFYSNYLTCSHSEVYTQKGESCVNSIYLVGNLLHPLTLLLPWSPLQPVTLHPTMLFGVQGLVPLQHNTNTPSYRGDPHGLLPVFFLLGTVQVCCLRLISYYPWLSLVCCLSLM